MARLASDIDLNQTKRMFEILQQETAIFKKYTTQDIEEMLGILKIIQVKK